MFAGQKGMLKWNIAYISNVRTPIEKAPLHQTIENV